MILPGQRMKAGTRQPRRSWLAAECAGAGLLFPLEQAGEIFPAAEILRQGT